jgi:hypothetical protein
MHYLRPYDVTTNLEFLASKREIEIVLLFRYKLMKFVGSKKDGISVEWWRLNNLCSNGRLSNGYVRNSKENWLHNSKYYLVICLQWREISWKTQTANRTQRILHSTTTTGGPELPHYRDLTIAIRHTTFCRTSLDEWTARRGNLYLITHNTNKRQTDMTPARFEPSVPASERPQTQAIDRGATRTG